MTRDASIVTIDDWAPIAHGTLVTDGGAPTEDRHEERLAGLSALGRQLLSAEGTEEMCAAVVDAAATDLALPATAIATFDGDDDRLRIAAAAPAAEDLPLAERCVTDDDIWEAFVTARLTETRFATNGHGETQRLVVAPLGKYGVLLTVIDDTSVSQPTVDFVEAVASTLSSALDRADREELLHRREETLTAQNQRLERVNRETELVREVTSFLVGVMDREAAFTGVCERLAGGAPGPYEMAWVGEVDVATDEVAPVASAGDDEGYLDAITVSAGGGAHSHGPGGLAVDTLEPHVVDDTLNDPPFDPWRRAALNRGYRSVAAVPIVRDDTLHGVLSVYGDEPDAFDDLTVSMFEDLCESLARALSRIDRERSRTSDERVVMTFDLGDSAPLIGVASALDATMLLTGVVDVGPDPRVYYAVEGADADAVHDAIHTLPGRDPTIVNDNRDGPGAFVEATATSESLVSHVADFGGSVERMEATPEGATATISLPVGTDVRQFVEAIERVVPGSSLSAKRRQEDPVRTLRDVEAELNEALTDRQLEVLKSAFHSGYFESPREFTGGEIAETLGISQPTFHSHLRNAQRSLFERLLDQPDGEDEPNRQ